MRREEPLSLSYWSIHGFGNCERPRSGQRATDTYEDRLFRKLERQGQQGFCVSHESPFERRRLRRWFVQTCPQSSFYWGRAEMCSCYNSQIGIYDAPARCVWMPAGQVPAFERLLSSLPRREHAIPVGPSLDPLVRRLLLRLNHCVFSCRDEPDPDDPYLLSVQACAQLDQLKVLCAITR